MEGAVASAATIHRSPALHSLFSGASLSPPPRRRRCFSPGATVTGSLSSELKEIRVCTNRTCRKQGSLQTLETLSGLAPADVTVKTCGCLGRCGSGPNLALLPEGVIVSHIGTAARASRILCDTDDLLLRSLEALALKKRADSELDRRNFSDAEALLTQAINSKPVGGIHVMYKDRSVARLGMTDYDGALEDAREATNLAPNYTEGYICEGDAFLAMEQFDKAEKSYSICLEIDPTIRRTISFKARTEKLREKLTAANLA
ncbi:uncharacterized protein LOC116215235 [Punica granatum]|uniref:Uncharacterized protein LOC116215235 n=2 Tax=Punica granatum TaxID=22663 RepID=A0A6P8END8_PUNGR|nr:uncharacterized protein LOC116215235 [Punica granatum]PKI63316.1 hypothetical protein CRG98_016307 [Punica granatum]